MAKKEVIKVPSKYTTLIILKEDLKRLTEARDQWKKDNKNFSQVGLSVFIKHLLDSYEEQRK